MAVTCGFCRDDGVIKIDAKPIVDSGRDGWMQGPLKV